MSKIFKSMAAVQCALLIAGLISIAHAQPCITGLDTVSIPRMWFPKQEGEERVKNFRLTKMPVLYNNSGIDQFGRLTLGNFLGMLSYFDGLPNYDSLRVYIGMYPSEESGKVPKGFGNQLTLMFSPVDEKGHDLNTDIYYMIPPGKYFDETNIGQFQIKGAEKDALVANYRDKMPLSTIDPSNDFNVCKTCHDHRPTDTWSITYGKSGLDELITEQKYCHRDVTNSVDIPLSKNFIAFFTAENRSAAHRDNYRIAIVFDFTSLSYNPISLEDTFGFAGRPSKLKPIDNGQLCPTYCQ